MDKIKNNTDIAELLNTQKVVISNLHKLKIFIFSQFQIKFSSSSLLLSYCE